MGLGMSSNNNHGNHTSSNLWLKNVTACHKVAWGAEFSVEPEAVIGCSLVIHGNLPDYDVAALGFGGSGLQLQGGFQRFLILS